MTEVAVPEIIELLDSYGDSIRWTHNPDSRGVDGHPGVPDFLIAGPRGVLHRETKPRRDSHLHPAQTAWRYMLVAAGADYGVWTLDDLEDGTCERQIGQLLA